MNGLNSNIKSEKKKNTLFLIWLILIMLTWIFGTKVSEMLLDFIQELSFEEIQLAESLFSYTIALTILFWGYLVDRFSEKRKIILVFCSILWICASFSLFFASINITVIQYK